MMTVPLVFPGKKCCWSATATGVNVWSCLPTTFLGDVTGDITGDVTGDVTGNVTGNINASSASGISTVSGDIIRVNYNCCSGSTEIAAIE